MRLVTEKFSWTLMEGLLCTQGLWELRTLHHLLLNNNCVPAEYEGEDIGVKHNHHEALKLWDLKKYSHLNNFRNSPKNEKNEMKKIPLHGG